MCMMHVERERGGGEMLETFSLHFDFLIDIEYDDEYTFRCLLLLPKRKIKDTLNFIIYIEYTELGTIKKYLVERKILSSFVKLV